MHGAQPWTRAMTLGEKNHKDQSTTRSTLTTLLISLPSIKATSTA